MAEYNESQINSNETERISAEQQRIENEAERQTKETEREARETARQSNESARISEYNTFITNAQNEYNSFITNAENAEDERKSNETTRQNNEEERIVKENERLVAEQNRVLAEEERQEFFNSVSSNVITPQMFGAKADGVTDDSQAILDAIEALPKDGGALYFPAGTYIHGDGTTTGLSYQIDTRYSEGHAYYPAPLMQNKGVDDRIGRDIRLIFEGYTNLTIKGDGAILQSHENNGECSNNGFFTFKRCENVIIEGITIDGKRHERGIKLSDYSPGGYDLTRTNLQFNRCKRVIVRNVISKGAMMDGMSIGAGSQTEYNEDFLVEKCKFLDNHRQGITIEGATNVTVRDTECSYNGTGQGILPKSGIDIEAYGDVSEYQHYSFNRNILVDKCYFDSNGSSNIIVNKNSFNTIIQNCTFKNAWVNAQANNEAKLLNCHLENCNLSNGFSRIAYNTIIYNKGGYLIRSTDVSENSTTIIEHNIFDLTPTSNTFNSINYNTVRLTGLEIFRDNYVKNAVATADSAHYSLFFLCKELTDNTFEMTNTSFNGVAVTNNTYIVAHSSDCIYKNNKFIGYVAQGSYNSYYRTDETMTRTYNSRLLSTSKVCKLLDYSGLIKITVRYLEQVEEILICRPVSNYSHHYVFRRNSNLAGTQLVTLYKDNSKNYYLKYTYTNTSTTIECAYTYGNTSVDGLEYIDWLTVSDVAESSLTKINHVDVTQLTTTLKSNYDNAYTHSTTSHAPANAQKNSDITKAEIEAKLTGVISSHSHDGMDGDYVNKNWGSENAGMVLMIGSDGNVTLYDLADYNPNAQWYSVTQNYTNVTSDFTGTQVKESLPLTIHLSSTNGKKLDDVRVVMNGQDVTADVYSDGTIVISSVTGAIIITADAMLYTNLADPTDPDWVNGSRMDNYGNALSTTYGITTNYIPAQAGDTIRIKGLGWIGYEGMLQHVVMYIRKKDGSKYYVQCLQTINNNGFFSSIEEDEENMMVTVVFKAGLDIGSIKVSGEIMDSEHRIETVIVTVNEEIID